MKFSTNKNFTKLTVKNSFYKTVSVLIAKFGGFILTILLARMLLPEMFGIYTLVLSIVLITFLFSDLGIGEVAIKYVSEAFGKNKRDEAFSYFWYLFKVRYALIILGGIVLLLFSRTLANNVFNKPEIFVPLFFGVLFIFVNSLRNFFELLFPALNDLKSIPTIHLILQSSKVILTSIVLLIFSEIAAVSAVFVAFATSSFISFLSVIWILKKKNLNVFSKIRAPINKKKVLHFLGFMSIASISLVLFGYVDIIMLGIFVESAYIGYYQVAFSLIASLIVLFSFSGVLLPIFTQIHGGQLKRALFKSLRYTGIIVIPAAAGLMFFARHVIVAFYGVEYAPAATVVYILAFLLLITPFASLYSSLFQAKDKVKTLAVIVFVSLALNIIINYVLITKLLPFGQNFVILGVALATLISRLFYFLMIIINARKYFEIQIPKIALMKSLFATLTMVFVLLGYNLYVDINILTGILEIVLGIFIYGIMMFLIKGIGKEDIDLVKSFFKK
jgi:O-antigen/teichoic acid export membrane protein